MSAPDPDNAGAGLGPLASPEPTLREDRVDLTLIRWMLSLTPAERLQVPATECALDSEAAR